MGLPPPISDPPGAAVSAPWPLPPTPQPPTMVSERLCELEEVSKELLKVLLEDWAGARLRRSLEKRSRAEDRLLAAQSSAARLVTGGCPRVPAPPPTVAPPPPAPCQRSVPPAELTAVEEEVARSLLEREEELQRCRRRRRELQEETERLQEAAGSLRADN